MKKYVAVGTALIIVVIGGVAFWLYTRTSDMLPESITPLTSEKSTIIVDGIIIKDKPGLKKGGWYFEYAESGSTATAPIMFNNNSVCSWNEASGRCKPSAFVNGRRAHLEGIDLGGAIGVVHLTFTEPPHAVEDR